MSQPDQKPPLFSGKLLVFVVLIAIVFGAALFTGLWPRRQKVAAITEQAKADASAAPVVTVAKAIPAPDNRELILPGTVSALLDTPIYARAEGYLKVLKADIGDVVKKSQVLVELETPELDQQLRQAHARLDQLKATLGQTQAQEQQVKANLKLAEVTLGRVRELVEQGVMSKQDGDDRLAQYDVRQAELKSAIAAIDVAKQNIAAQDAEIMRLEELSSFKMVRAPFDGVITVRNAATGNLIIPATGTAGRELFRMANNDILRVFVSVPQSSIPDVRVGQKAEVAIADRPNEKFIGNVSRDANAIDVETRTQRTEVRVVNRQNKLLPGMYVQVKFLGAKPRSMVMIPGDTLVTRADGAYVAAVGDGSKVEFKKLVLGRDLGTQVEVLGGLSGDELLIVNPSDVVQPGIRVRPSPRK